MANSVNNCFSHLLKLSKNEAKSPVKQLLFGVKGRIAAGAVRIQAVVTLLSVGHGHHCEPLGQTSSW